MNKYQYQRGQSLTRKQLKNEGCDHHRFFRRRYSTQEKARWRRDARYRRFHRQGIPEKRGRNDINSMAGNYSFLHRWGLKGNGEGLGDARRERSLRPPRDYCPKTTKRPQPGRLNAYRVFYCTDCSPCPYFGIHAKLAP